MCRVYSHLRPPGIDSVRQRPSHSSCDRSKAPTPSNSRSTSESSHVMTSQIYISVARMHHISNPSKFRRLKRFAEQSNVSGLVKTGKPGILVFDGERESIKVFLEHARGLRYLDFHHLDTKPLALGRVADAKSGLQEVHSTSELVNRLESVREKDWFRVQMRMAKEGGT
ncbi:hypothetical protein D9619_004399 [Psilocybe cf. subviscida]|uniref:Uncharacterized protein n=1 Tax=Psilocybe cf. subviscida TaxID=2480587 RepID=A0A8H5BPI6_9AGAR|nr:hypothetical protein D9619_004399 [Psilocybe cf. subviscida]